MTSLSLQRNEPASTGRWVWAIAGAMVWHALVLGLLAIAQPFAASEALPVHPRPVDLVFEPSPADPDPPAPSDEGMKEFTELPVDRSDVAPEKADLRSNVNSRARDLAKADETTELPRGEGESERPSVAMDPRPTVGGDPSQGLVPDMPVQPGAEDDRQDPGPLEAGEVEEAQTAREEARTGDAGGGNAPGRLARTGDPEAEILRRPSPTRLEAPRYRIELGGQGVFQEELNNPTGNVLLFGDISLNTLAWDWAPWIQRFRRDYYRNWMPPYAFLIGVIHGREVVDLEVARDGKVLKMEVVEEEGHESLTQSTLATFRSFAPYQPLPADFPEETLQLRITVIYPERTR